METIIQFLNRPAVAAMLWGIFIVEVILILSIRRNIALTNASEYLFACLEKIYFCHYDLKTIHLTQFFPRYRETVDWGFCAPVAALSMMALHDNQSARFVCALAGEKLHTHCWVEFEYKKRWYIIDPCWHWPFLVPKAKYYHENKPQILQVCEYDEFWSYGVSQQIYEKLQTPQKSWLIWELMCIYRMCYGEDDRLFDEDIATCKLEEESGEHINKFLFYYYPQIVFSRQIMHEMMQRPRRLHPKAHMMRKVKWYQKQVKQAYDAYFIETHQEEMLVDHNRLDLRAEAAS